MVDFIRSIADKGCCLMKLFTSLDFKNEPALWVSVGKHALGGGLIGLIIGKTKMKLEE